VSLPAFRYLLERGGVTMPDFEVEAIHELLTAIADGKGWEDLRTTYPDLTEEQFNELKRFVQNCQAIDRNAWKTWSDEEIQRLRGLNYHGASVAEIAHELGRCKPAVEIMLPRPKRRSA